jgi:hypothetical protein
VRNRRRSFLCLAVAAIVGASVTLVGVAESATADVGPPANPWTFSMNDPRADGLVIHGTGGNSNPFIVFDRYGQPIAAVGEAGGLKVFGDNIGVNPGSDIFHSQVTISPGDPVAAVCVRPGQLWLGGPEGHVWRCAGAGRWAVLL